jgi:hypothetical protein
LVTRSSVESELRKAMNFESVPEGSVEAIPH